MKYLIIILGLCALIPTTLLAQVSLDRYVVTTTGSGETNGYIYLQHTVGEPAIETLNSGNKILTQGFQQTDFLYLNPISKVGEPLTFNIRLSPNPTSGWVSVEFPELREAVNLSLMNATGKIIRSEQVKQGQRSHRLNLSGLPAGIYMLRMRSGRIQGHTSISLVR